MAVGKPTASWGRFGDGDDALPSKQGEGNVEG